MAKKVGTQTKKVEKVSTTENVPDRISNKLNQLLVAEDRATSTGNVMRWFKRWRVYVIGSAVFVIILLLILFIQQDKPQIIHDPVRQMPDINQSDSVEDTVRHYGADYDASLQEVTSQSTTDWSQEMLDEAYFSLLYADKTGAFTQVYTLLSLIESAKQAGFDIDDNAYGIDQNDRDDIKQRADVEKRKVQAASEGGGRDE